MLKIKFMRVKNIILMEILEQGDEIERGRYNWVAWVAPNGIKIQSSCCPDLSKDFIFIRSDVHDKDNIVTCQEYACEEDAINALQKYAEAVRDYNNWLRKKEKEIETGTEFDEVVIAE